jgi:hypothetical protein
MRLSGAQLSALVEGLDWARVAPQRGTFTNIRPSGATVTPVT